MTATKPVMIYFFMIRFIGLFATDYSAAEKTTGPALADKDFFQKNEGAGRGRVYG
jgi:hypothetical protein